MELANYQREDVLYTGNNTERDVSGHFKIEALNEKVCNVAGETMDGELGKGVIIYLIYEASLG
jgi:hypothetical protein